MSNNENFKPNGANKCNYVPNTFEKKNLLSTKQLHFVGKEIPNHTMSWLSFNNYSVYGKLLNNILKFWKIADLKNVEKFLEKTCILMKLESFYLAR